MTEQRLFQERATLDEPPPQPDAPGAAGDAPSRWRERRLAGQTLRLGVLGAPVLAAGLVVVGGAGAWPRPAGLAAGGAWWLVLVAGAMVTMWAVWGLARRLLPLAALLQVPLAFPGPAPRRLWIGLGAGTSPSVEARLDALRERGLSADPLRAATQAVVLLAAVGRRQWRAWVHAERVAHYADAAAERLGVSETDRDRLRWASLLHDIGTLLVEPAIAGRARTLDGTEWQAARAHPLQGSQLISSLRPWMGEWASAVDQHHERWDGYGYPAALAADQIGLGARIVAVADAFEVMTAPWSYRPATSSSAARKELLADAGRHFDPDVVRAFVDLPLRRVGGRAVPYRLRAETPVLARVRRPATLAAGSALLVTVALLAGLAPTRRSRPPQPPPLAASDDRGRSPMGTPDVAPSPSSPGASTPNIAPATPPATTVDVTRLPMTVTLEYASAVMTSLDQSLGDAIRVLVADPVVSPDFSDRLAGLYVEPELTKKRTVYLAETARNVEAFRDNPPNPVTVVDAVVSAEVSCAVLAVQRDFSALLDNPGRGPVNGFIALTPKVGRNETRGQNPTTWKIAFDGVTLDGAPPTTPC